MIGQRWTAVVDGVEVGPIHVTMRDSRAWDRAEKGRNFLRQQADLSQADISWLLWHAAQRAGQTGLTWGQWDETFDDFDPVDEEEGPDPTGATPTTASAG